MNEPAASGEPSPSSELAAVRHELRRCRQQSQKLLYSISHDLKEPLRAVLGFSKLLVEHSESSLDETGLEFLDFVQQNAERIDAMLDGILRLSRIETHGGPLVPLSLADVLEQFAESTELHRNVQLELKVDHIPSVQGDRKQLIGVLEALVDNARKFADGDRPRVKIEAGQQDERVVVRVEDYGPGFDPKYRDAVFDVFRKLHAGNSYPGIGIGLTLAHRVIERHGGEIWFETTGPDATVVSFAIPIG